MVHRPHWSYSQLSQFLRCPLQFFFERVAKLPKPFVSSNLVLGSAVHESLATYHRDIQAGTKTTREQIEQRFLAAWKQRQDERPLSFGKGETAGSAVEQGMALLEAYLNEPPPQNILAVEQELAVPLHNSRGEFLEKPLVAVLDLLCQENLGLTVTEFKTSGRRYSEADAATALQPVAYAHAVREKYGEPAKVRYAILLKTKTAGVQYLETRQDDENFGRLGDVVQSVELAINAGAFYPVENPLNCSGCPFRKPCREWSGGNQESIQRNQTSRTSEAAAC